MQLPSPFHNFILLYFTLFDYCKNLLFNIPAYKLNILQTLHNAVARCVCQLPCRSTDSIKSLLKQFPWLSIIYCTKYKLSLSYHRFIHHNSPDYLVPFVSRSTTNITITRSSNTFLIDTTILIIPTQPVYNWKSLNVSLRTILSTSSFKRHFKTHYFS